MNDILNEVFGYDKYLELTAEFAIRGTYCDIAVKIGKKVEYIIEVKAIGIELKDAHMKQACDYGANLGVQWIILTNGINWRIYRIRFEQPIAFDMIYSFNMLDVNPKNENHAELLYIISREGLEKNAREIYYEKIQSVNRFTVGNILLREEVLKAVHRELKRLTNGDIRIELAEIEHILKTSIFKREITEGDEADSAKKRINKFYKKIAAPAKKKAPKDNAQNFEDVVDKASDTPNGDGARQPVDEDEDLAYV